MKKLGFLILVLCFALTFSVLAFAEAEGRDVSFEEGLASDLKALGLFSGVSETNFDLERVPTRTEVLVMLIRVLGEEKAALEGEFEHPFTDVPEWADKYVGYAYENGLTKGVSATKFGTDYASSTTYLTFMLRALGYSDANGDFAWDNPHTLAEKLGLLPSVVDTENFIRADIVTVSYAALSQNLKGSTVSLAEKLIEKEVFTADTYAKSYRATKLTDKENEGKTPLSSDEIYNKCSEAVALIKAYDEDGEELWYGSGFFIDESGMLVTTFYAAGGAPRLEVVLPSSGKTYSVSGVYDYSGRYDWIVLDVEGEGFATLPINTMPVKGAATVYAIGSPEGLENTVSEGIVSNARRVLGDYTYFQTTAQISDGSFGGPVLNVYGEVIGIVHSYDYDGQTLNFALPINALATADLGTVTPYADCDYSGTWYYPETDELTVKVGEGAEFSFEYDSLATYPDYAGVELKVTSADNSIATAVLGRDHSRFFGSVYVIGQSAGTTEVVISDNRSQDTYTFTVTVLDNPDITSPKVIYDASMDNVKLYNGDEKTVYIDIIECGIAEDATGFLAANYSAKCSNSKIKLEFEVAKADSDEDYIKAYPEYAGKSYPFITLTVSGTNDAKGEITVTNDKTGDTLVIPVTVGDRYESAHKELAEGIMASELVEHKTGDTPEDEAYVYEASEMGVTERVAYYPASGDIEYYAGGTLQQVTVYYGLTLAKDGTVSYEITMAQAGLNIKAAGEIDNPETFVKNIDSFKHDVFECPEVYKEAIEPELTYMLAMLLYSLDLERIPMFCENLDMGDFGFLDIDTIFY